MMELVKSRRQEVATYDPQSGLKEIAVAEAAEKHFARAKDSEHLYEAIALKLQAQREFVVWWDAQDFKGGNPTVTGLQRLEDLGVDRVTVHRWRKKLKDDAGFSKALEAAQERCRRVCEAEKGSTEQKGASGTGENEWYTPDEHLRAARDVLGEIDLDPASSDAAQKIVKAGRYFTEKDDGLEQEWHGRVWLNPPYAQPAISYFVSKMVKEVTVGRVQAAIMLTHNYTDTAWFHEAASVADAICFTRGRVKFYDAKGNVAAPTQGQAFCYFGQNKDEFAERFRKIGFVVFPYTGEVA